MSDAEKLREAVNKAMCPAPGTCEDVGTTQCFACVREANKALAAIDAAGFAVVPKVATEEMACAGAANLRNYMTVAAPYPRTRAMYAAMLAAAPKVTP